MKDDSVTSELPDERAEFSVQRLLRARRLARSAWGAAILLCVALGSVVALSLVNDYRSQRQLAETHVSALAEVERHAVVASLESTESALNAISDYLTRDGPKMSLSEFLELQDQRLRIGGPLAVINAAGRLMASSGPFEALHGQDFRQAPWFHIHQRDDDTSLYIGQPLRLQPDGEQYLPLSLHIPDSEGRLMAVAVAFMGERDLSELIKIAGSEGHGITTRLHFNGTVVATSPYDPTLISVLVDHSPSLTTPEDGTVSANWMDEGSAVIMAWRHLQPWPLTVEVAISLSAVYAGFERQLVLWSGLSVIMLLLVLLATRNHVQQILRLYLQASVIERKNVDLRAAHENLKREVQEREHIESQRDSFFNLSADLLAILDSEGRVVRLNPAFAETLGESEESLRGVDLASFMDADDVHGFRTAIETVEADGGARPIEARCQTIEGVRWFLWTLVGRRGFVYAVAHDFTTHRLAAEALREAKDAAEAANDTKTQFLANMSHELRTPLNAIIGFSETLELGLYGPLNDKQREYVMDIHSAGKHLLGIVIDLLDLSVIDSGAMVLKDSPCNLRELIEQALALVRTRADEAKIALFCELPDPLPRVMVDCGKIRQIFVNLLSNAVKFTQAGGEIRVTATLDALDGGLVVSVRDTGIGIKAADIPQVLSPFGRRKAAYASKHGGIGLGLPLALRLAELHQGDLAIISQPGVGTTVRLWLPPERILYDELIGESQNGHHNQHT